MVERLQSWHAVCLHEHNRRYLPGTETCGQTAAGLMDAIAGASVRWHNLWVVSYQCARVWALLGIWEMIEDGRITITDSDHRGSQAARERMRQYRLRLHDPLRAMGGAEIARVHAGTGGYLVIEDPPCILRCRLHDKGKPVQWIDIRNHGITLPPDVMPGAETAAWLARLVCRMCDISRANNLSSIKATAGSQAMSAWRYGYLQETPYVHSDPAATALEHAAYYGGRCEATAIGLAGERVYHLDFRSQYGYVCAAFKLPVRLLRTGDGSSDMVGRMPEAGTGAVADVTIETDEPAYPVRRPDGVIYPIGRYRTVLCGPELTDAIHLGRVSAVHTVATYEMGYPLRAYAEALYALRCQEEREGVPGSADWIKRLLVSLPGKLGQLDHKWIDCPNVMPNAPGNAMYGEWYDEEGARYRVLGGIVQRDVVGGYAADSVPAIAGFVTSYGRTRLLSAIRTAGWANVFYYDTDSLFVNRDGYERLRQSEFMAHTGLGALTERTHPAYFEIRGVKYYVKDKDVVCAGLAKGHVVDSGDGHTFTRYLTPAEQARTGRRPESVLIHGVYVRANPYTLGNVGPDGRVTPIRLEE